MDLTSGTSGLVPDARIEAGLTSSSSLLLSSSPRLSPPFVHRIKARWHLLDLQPPSHGKPPNSVFIGKMQAGEDISSWREFRRPGGDDFFKFQETVSGGCDSLLKADKNIHQIFQATTPRHAHLLYSLACEASQ